MSPQKLFSRDENSFSTTQFVSFISLSGSIAAMDWVKSVKSIYPTKAIGTVCKKGEGLGMKNDIDAAKS